MPSSMRLSDLGTWAAVSAAIALGAAAMPGCVVDDTESPDPLADEAQHLEVLASLEDPQFDAEFLAAMKRDLGLDEVQTRARVAAEAAALRSRVEARALLGSAFAGAWFDGETLNVALTDPALEEDVRLLGAKVHVVPRSLASLDAIKEMLDAAPLPASDFYAWYVDPEKNAVVVDVADPDAARAVLEELGVADAVHLVASRPVAPMLGIIKGGDEFRTDAGGGARCSVGFAADVLHDDHWVRGFLTAGHCWRSPNVNRRIYDNNWQERGGYTQLRFPGADYAAVRINSHWDTIPYTDAGGQYIRVANHATLGNGDFVCRDGITTGTRCGNVLATNVSVNYPEGRLNGMTKTNVGTQPGDSGGPFYRINSAVGVVSGGAFLIWPDSFETYYQPIGPILADTGAILNTVSSLRSRLGDLCIDVPGGNFAAGQPVKTWRCNGQSPQIFEHSEQRWSTVAGYPWCLDIKGGNGNNGTPIVLWHCHDRWNQQFHRMPNGELRNPLTGKCIDIAGWNQNPGGDLILWTCHGGANQLWDRL